ncbi:UNKNOWN [Stylonychia lemnae]|uniref:MACPF domain-containing protein n=1 Tax=Stylonychia lemnae TaxID=5949 RepID=A0A077ZPE9_STYLE|nr:UNKNOWN [Stylonychia lemnae]|eukprot:CDW71832.1 UNKNOWN [Stylonychia lemnae]
MLLPNAFSISLKSKVTQLERRSEVKAEVAIGAALEMPYSQGIQLLQGIDTGSYKLKGNPFKLDGSGTKVESKAVASDIIQRDVVSNSQEYAANLKASADFSFSGWKASVQFNFAMEKDVKFVSNQQLFVAWRKIVNGYDGYEYPPPLTEYAKQMLQSDGGADTFKQYFGDYYVKGCVNGASMRMIVRTSGSSSSEKESMDLSLKAAYNGAFMSVSGGAGFSQALASSQTMNLESVEIYYSGQDRGSGVRSLSIAQADQELVNFASIAKTGTPLYCLLELYNTHPDYIQAITSKGVPVATTSPAKAIDDFLNDILYTKMIQLQIIMQWYLDASESQQKVLDEADFVSQVLLANEALESSDRAVISGSKHIDVLGIQLSIDNLEQVFFSNGIRDQVLSPTEVVGPLLDSYIPTLTNSLTLSSDTSLAVDTAFKVQDLATSLDFLGQVALNMGFSLQSQDHATVGQDQNALNLLKRFQATTIQPIGAFLDRSIASNPFPQTSVTKDVNLLRTLNSTVVSAKGSYSDTIFTTVCGAKLIDCINAFKNLCGTSSALFDTIRTPSYSSHWVWQSNGERKVLIPQFNPYVAIMLSSYVNLIWVIGAQDRKANLNSQAPSTASSEIKKMLECAFRSFMDSYQRKFSEIITYYNNNWTFCFDKGNSWCELDSNQLLVGLKKTANDNDLASIDLAIGGVGPWTTLSGQANCPSWGRDLDGKESWARCDQNLLIKGFFRETGIGGGNLASIADGKCSSPTPGISFENCYEQDVVSSFDTTGNYGYCQRPGYFWFGLRAGYEGAVRDLDKIQCCKPTYAWQKLSC